MIRKIMILLLLCTSLSACTQGQEPNTGQEPSTGQEPNEGQEELDIYDADVERIEIEVSESEPTRVQVTVYGRFISGCMTLYETKQRREGDTFFIKMTMAEPAGESCTPNAPPFTETVMLEGELSSGTYVANVNGVTETFTLP